MKKITRLFYALIAVIITINLHAQSPGTNCSTAFSISTSSSSSSSGTFNQSNTDGWFQFTATDVNYVFTIKNLLASGDAGKIVKAEAYSGSCSSTTSLTSIGLDSLSSTGDSLLELSLSGLTIGNNYFVYAKKEFQPWLCTSTTGCFDNAKFQATILSGLYCGILYSTQQPYQSNQSNAWIFPNGLGCVVWNDPNNLNPLPSFLSVCNISICKQTLYLGYYPTMLTPAQPDLESLLATNYTVFVFSNVGPTYSVGCVSIPTGTNSTITFPAPGQYTLCFNSGCGNINITPQLTVADVAACSCRTLVVDYAAPPSCNFSAPNPLCANTSFCLLGVNNPSPPYTINCTIGGNPYPNGCVPGGLPTGNYSVTYKASLLPQYTGLNSTCSCSATGNIFVGGPALPITVGSSTNEICLGKCVTLYAAYPPYTSNSFTWQPGNIIGDVVSVCPTTTTTYTVYVLSPDGGCLAQGMVTISVFTVAPTFTPSLTQPFVCLPNNSTTLNINPPGTYTVLTPSPISVTNSIVLSPNVTTIYTVQAYDPSGCLMSSTIQAAVVPCSCLTEPGTEYSGLVNYGSISANTKIKIVANTTLTEAPFTPTSSPYFGFIGNDVTVYPGVQILLSPASGGTLYIESCHFHGCGEMWEGIKAPYVNQKYRFRNNPSIPNVSNLIEDARIGIEFLNQVQVLNPVPASPDLIIDVDNVTFNKCMIGIKIQPYQYNLVNYPFKITNSLFTSRNIPITPNPNPNNVPTWPNTNTIKLSTNVGYNPVQTPYINNTSYPPTPIISNLYNYFGYPEEGIELNTVGYTYQPVVYLFRGIKIGQNGVPNFNCFDHLHTDIYAYNSNLTVVNCVFQNGETFGDKKGNQVAGAAIVALSDINNSITNRNYLEIGTGAGNGNFNCRFYEKTGCADITDYFDVQIHDAQAYSLGNNYNQFNLNNTFGERGFNIKTNRYENIILQNNKLYNIKNAMMIGINNLASGPNLIREVGQIIVRDNIVDRTPAPVLSYGAAPYVNIALSISDPGTGATSLSYPGSLGGVVLNNYFNRVNNGISVMNLNPSPIGIQSNTVNMVNEYPTFNPAPVQMGISVINCKKQTTVHQNNVRCILPTWSTEMRAISTSVNSLLSVRCNTTQNVERGIEFNGIQNTTSFEDNHMTNETFGLALDNGAKIALGAPVGTPSRPTNNVWNGTWANPGFETAVFGGSSAQNSKLYICTSNPLTNPNGSSILMWGGTANDLYFTGGANPTLLNSSCITPGCRIPNGNGNGNGGRLAVEEIDNNINIYVGDMNDVNKNNLYRYISSNPEALSSSNSLNEFYESSKNTNLEKMMEIEKALVSDINDAQNKIASFRPLNRVEENYKTFYSLYSNVSSKTNQNADSVRLITLANKCPYAGGAVIFQARALYNQVFNGYYRFSNNCNGKIAQSIPGTMQQKDINVILKSSLFPNPNDGNYIIKINGTKETSENIEVSVYDITGKEIYTDNKFLDGSSEFKVNNNLANGTYLVKVKMSDGTVDMHRLIITK